MKKLRNMLLLIVLMHCGDHHELTRIGVPPEELENDMQSGQMALLVGKGLQGLKKFLGLSKTILEEFRILGINPAETHMPEKINFLEQFLDQDEMGLDQESRIIDSLSYIIDWIGGRANSGPLTRLHSALKASLEVREQLERDFRALQMPAFVPLPIAIATLASINECLGKCLHEAQTHIETEHTTFNLACSDPEIKVHTGIIERAYEGLHIVKRILEMLEIISRENQSQRNIEAGAELKQTLEEVSRLQKSRLEVTEKWAGNNVPHFTFEDGSRMSVEDFSKKVNELIKIMLKHLTDLQTTNPNNIEDIEKLTKPISHAIKARYKPWCNSLPPELINCFSVLRKIRELCYGTKMMHEPQGFFAFLITIANKAADKTSKKAYEDNEDQKAAIQDMTRICHISESLLHVSGHH